MKYKALVCFWAKQYNHGHRLLRRTLVRSVMLFIFSCMVGLTAIAQEKEKQFTHADTLRGSNNENRSWWDVLRYDITVKPDYEKKTIEGMCAIRYNILRKGDYFQIDLQQPLEVNKVSFFFNFSTIELKMGKDVTRQGNVLFIKNVIGETKGILNIQFHGKPIEAVKPPWDGGWVFKKDKLGRPWMSVAVQGLGASAWFPCKDYQGDEPDNGASLTVIVPDTLVAVGNGRLIKKDTTTRNEKRETVYTWEVKNPINNYTIVPNIGKYVNFTDTMMGEKRQLDVSFWVLDYNLEKAKEHFKQAKQMLRAFEYWFGPYPFYEDSYKLVDAPFLGMEHQSNVAYGNGYQNGYNGKDLSATGWGMKWDFMIVHESGHEWFANNITTKDIADMWVHEGFTNYSEVLFTEYYYGKKAGNEYCYGLRKRIENKYPIIMHYSVNQEPYDNDQYYKASNMINTIRHAMNDDVKFRAILRGLNKTFYHKTVTTKQVEDYINKQSGFSFQKVFDQYLRTIQIPTLEYKISNNNEITYRWIDCNSGFNLPIVLSDSTTTLKLKPTIVWQTIKLNANQQKLLTKEMIEQNYYVKTKETKETK